MKIHVCDCCTVRLAKIWIEVNEGHIYEDRWFAQIRRYYCLECLDETLKKAETCLVRNEIDVDWERVPDAKEQTR